MLALLLLIVVEQRCVNLRRFRRLRQGILSKGFFDGIISQLMLLCHTFFLVMEEAFAEDTDRASKEDGGKDNECETGCDNDSPILHVLVNAQN